jgi:hypothetical protein
MRLRALLLPPPAMGLRDMAVAVAVGGDALDVTARQLLLALLLPKLRRPPLPRRSLPKGSRRRGPRQ